MQTTIHLHPGPNDARDVRVRVDSASITIYSLVLSRGLSPQEVMTADPRIARDYFAAIAKAAQELVDAADEAVLAESLDLPTAVSA